MFFYYKNSIFGTLTQQVHNAIYHIHWCFPRSHQTITMTFHGKTLNCMERWLNSCTFCLYQLVWNHFPKNEIEHRTRPLLNIVTASLGDFGVRAPSQEASSLSLTSPSLCFVIKPAQTDTETLRYKRSSF